MLFKKVTSFEFNYNKPTQRLTQKLTQKNNKK